MNSEEVDLSDLIQGSERLPRDVGTQVLRGSFELGDDRVSARRRVELSDGHFVAEEVRGEETKLTWTYSFHPRSPFLRQLVARFVNGVRVGLMRNALEGMRTGAEVEPRVVAPIGRRGRPARTCAPRRHAPRQSRHYGSGPPVEQGGRARNHRLMLGGFSSASTSSATHSA